MIVQCMPSCEAREWNQPLVLICPPTRQRIIKNSRGNISDNASYENATTYFKVALANSRPTCSAHNQLSVRALLPDKTACQTWGLGRTKWYHEGWNHISFHDTEEVCLSMLLDWEKPVRFVYVLGHK